MEWGVSQRVGALVYVSDGVLVYGMGCYFS